jgi:hypothetical protein
MFCEAFGEHSLVGQRFLNGIHISRPVECQLKKTNIHCDQIREIIHEDRCRTIHELADTVGSVMEFDRRS